MGILDGNYGGGLLDPNTASLLGFAAGIGQASGPSRMPISMGQAFGGGIEGMLSGQRSALQSNLLAQEAQKNQLGNALMAQQLGLTNDALSGTGFFGPQGGQGGQAPASPQTAGGMLAGTAPAPSSSEMAAPSAPAGVSADTWRRAVVAERLVKGGGNTILAADPAIVGPKAAAEAQAQAPYKAAVALLERAGYVHNIGPNERGVTGFQALEGDPVFRQIMGQAGINVPAPQSTPAPTGGGAASLNAPNAAPQGFDPKLWGEIPATKLPAPAERGPGGVMQGVSSAQINMQEKANEEKKGIDEAGAAASGQLGQLKSLEGSLASGQFSTDATAPMRAVMSSYVNAFAGRDLAQKLTGIDPAQAEFFNKDATRMGLMFARQTEGAREAVAAIKIALGANPSLQNTMAANKMIVQAMERAAIYSMQTQHASDGYFFKNGHNVGFGGWWNNAHPASEYTTGKALPYDVPIGDGGGVDTKMLIPGFYYRGARGIGKWNGSGFEMAPQ